LVIDEKSQENCSIHPVLRIVSTSCIRHWRISQHKLFETTVVMSSLRFRWAYIMCRSKEQFRNC